MSIKEYYDKYIDKEHYCAYCGKTAIFKGLHKGYGKYCSLACKKKNWHKVVTNSIQRKYGCDNVFQSEKIKIKIRQTNLEKYGDEHPTRWNSEKFNKAMNDKYGSNWIYDLSKKGVKGFRKKYRSS